MNLKSQVGSAAEYVTTLPKHLSKSPTKIDLLQAAALPGVGATAIIALRYKTKLRKGERLLVHGASGGVGSIAVQIGRMLGAHVTALANANILNFCRRSVQTKCLTIRKYPQLFLKSLMSLWTQWEQTSNTTGACLQGMEGWSQLVFPASPPFPIY